MIGAAIEPAAAEGAVARRDVALALTAGALALTSAGLAMYTFHRIGLGRPAALTVSFAMALVSGAAFVSFYRRIANARVRAWLRRALSVPFGYLAGWYLIVPGFFIGSVPLIWVAFAVEIVACVSAFAVAPLRHLRVGTTAALVGGLLAATLFTSLTTDGLLA